MNLHLLFVLQDKNINDIKDKHNKDMTIAM